MQRIAKALTIVSLTGLLLAGCKSNQVGYVSPTIVPTGTVAPGLSKPVSLVLKPQNNSGQPGTATIEDLGNNQTRVTLELTGTALKSTVAEPAHIHTGTCVKPGNVVYPLNDVVKGKSITVIDTNFTTVLATGTLINVHKSAKESSVYVSCGEFVNAVPMANPSPTVTPKATTAPVTY